jgi:uncharacterized Zn-finger protein
MRVYYIQAFKWDVPQIVKTVSCCAAAGRAFNHELHFRSTGRGAFRHEYVYIALRRHRLPDSESVFCPYCGTRHELVDVTNDRKYNKLLKSKVFQNGVTAKRTGP